MLVLAAADPVVLAAPGSVFSITSKPYECLPSRVTTYPVGSTPGGMFTFRSMCGGSSRLSAASAKLRAKRPAGPNSKRLRVARLKAIAGTPRKDASMAAATVPE